MKLVIDKNEPGWRRKLDQYDIYLNEEPVPCLSKWTYMEVDSTNGEIRFKNGYHGNSEIIHSGKVRIYNVEPKHDRPSSYLVEN